MHLMISVDLSENVETFGILSKIVDAVSIAEEEDAVSRGSSLQVT